MWKIAILIQKHRRIFFIMHHNKNNDKLIKNKSKKHTFANKQIKLAMKIKQVWKEEKMKKRRKRNWGWREFGWEWSNGGEKNVEEEEEEKEDFCWGRKWMSGNVVVPPIYLIRSLIINSSKTVFLGKWHFSP